MVDDDGTILELSSTWPGTTIDGEPGIRSGGLVLTREPDGSVLLSGSDGPDDGAPEDQQYWEFVLSPEQADALLDALQRSRP